MGVEEMLTAVTNADGLPVELLDFSVEEEPPEHG